MSDNKKLHGLGRKIELGKASGILQEGQFRNNELNGFGRCISSDSTMAIGFFKNGLLHGFARRVDAEGNPTEKRFEETDWKTGL
jgi:hypothetical protein